MGSPTDLFAACQNVEPEDEEEVGRTPSPGYSNRNVPLWHEGNRTGGGKRFKQDSEQQFPPLPNGQVRIKLSHTGINERRYNEQLRSIIRACTIFGDDMQGFHTGFWGRGVLDATAMVWRCVARPFIPKGLALYMGPPFTFLPTQSPFLP